MGVSPMRKKALSLCLGLLLSSIFVSAQSDKFLQMDRSIVESRLQQYAGMDSKRAETMKGIFEEAGCQNPNLEEQPVPKTDAPNVICTLPGAGEEVIIVGAHFDYVTEGQGVVDNWSGASLLPSLFQSLNSIPRKHTYIFIGFTNEEEGMIGSSYYAKGLSEVQVSRIQAMINLDTLGLGPTEIWAHDSDPKLVKNITSLAAAMKLPVHNMDVDQFGDSDNRSFKLRHVPVLTLHSVTLENLNILHSSQDNLNAIKLDDYYDSYRLIAGYLAYLDTTF
jgi:hypothetical protein